MSGRYQIKGLFRLYTQGLHVISGLMGQENRFWQKLDHFGYSWGSGQLFACSPETYLLFLLIAFPVSPVPASRAAV